MAGPSAFFTNSVPNKPRQSAASSSRPGNNRNSSRQNFSRQRPERTDRQYRPGQPGANRGFNARNEDKPESFTRLLKSRGNRLPPTFNDGKGFLKRGGVGKNRAAGSSLLAAMKATTITSFSGKFDPWDQQNQAELRAMASNSGKNNDYQELYSEFQKRRLTERKEMEKRGLVDAPDARKSLTDALVFSGSCPDMCPVFERVRRVHENMIMNLERGEDGQVTEQRAIKAFSRPAAGQLPPLPSDVRPPPVLVKTLSYLIREIYPRLPSSHPFLWDRLRSIRQDFTYQNYVGPEAILCNEIIVRTHISTMHVMADSGVEYSQQQEFEQLNKALQSLSEFYSLPANRANEKASLHEPEMRAFQLMSHVNDKDLNSTVEGLPNHIRNHPLVILSRKLRGYINNLGNNTGNFAEFFRVMSLPEIPILFKCLLEPSFTQIRLSAVRCLNSTLHAKKKDYPVERFMEMLGFANQQELQVFASEAGLGIGAHEDHGPFITIAPISDELYAKIKGTHHRSSLIPRFPSFDEIINGSSYQIPPVASQTRAEIDRILDTTKLQQELKDVKLLPEFSKEEWIRHMEETLRASQTPVPAPSAGRSFSFGADSGGTQPPAAPAVAPSGKFAKFKEMQAQKLARERAANQGAASQGTNAIAQNNLNAFTPGAASATSAAAPFKSFAADSFSLSGRPAAPAKVSQSAFAVTPQPASQPPLSAGFPAQPPRPSVSAFSTVNPISNAPASGAFAQKQVLPSVTSAPQPSVALGSLQAVSSQGAKRNSIEPAQFKSTAPPAPVLNFPSSEAARPNNNQPPKPSFATGDPLVSQGQPTTTSAGTPQSNAAPAFSFGANLKPSQEPAAPPSTSPAKPAAVAATPALLFKSQEPQEPQSASVATALRSVPATGALTLRADADRAAFVKRIVDHVTAEALRLEAYNISRFESMVARASIEIAERKGLQALLGGALQLNLAQAEPVESAIPVREEDILDLVMAVLCEKRYASIMICLPDWEGFTGILLRWNLQLEPTHGSNGVYFCASHERYDGGVYITTNPNESVDLAVFINMSPSDVPASTIATLELTDQAPAVKARLLEFLDDLPENDAADELCESVYSESVSDQESCMSLDFIDDNGRILEADLNNGGRDIKKARFV